jgi:hypothetical protein
VSQNHAGAIGDSVDRALGANGEFHDQQFRPIAVGKKLKRLLEPHRKEPWAFVQKRVRTIDGGIEDAIPTRSGRDRGLEADSTLGVTKLVCGPFNARRASYST